jgi:hypothetical protein
MKTVLRLSIILTVFFVFTGCRKVLLVAEQNPIEGSWYISDVSRHDAGGWYGVSTGLENGVFRFYPDGTMQYSDNLGTLYGNWYMRFSTNGYYDQYGNYYTDSHQSLELHVVDYSSHATIDLSFDDVGFYGNEFVATVYNGSFIEKYHFVRY